MDWATKEGFFKAKVPREKMSVPEIGDIWVYGLTAGQKDEYESGIVRYRGNSAQLRLANARAQLLLLIVHDQHGKRLFAEADMGRLSQLPAVIAEPILDVGRRLSGMGTSEIEELVKNSQTAQGLESEDSSTG